MKHLKLTLILLLVSVATYAIGPISGPTQVCVGSTITLMDVISPGGMWTSSNPGVATIGSTSGIVTGITPGVVTITYADSGAIVTYGVTVNPTPPPPVGPSHICAGTSTALSNAMVGGVWSSSSTTVATVGSSTGVVTGVSAGVVTITYSLPSGCFSTLTMTIDPIPTITGTLTVTVSGTTTLTGTPTGGSWSSSSTAIATVGTAGTVTGVATGTATITYTSPAGCSATVVVTVTPSTAILQQGQISTMVSMSPNPASGTVNIQWTGMSTGKTEVVITDITGRVIKTQTMQINTSSGSASLDISELNTGLYLVTIRNHDLNYCGKLRVER